MVYLTRSLFVNFRAACLFLLSEVKTIHKITRNKMKDCARLGVAVVQSALVTFARSAIKTSGSPFLSIDVSLRTRFS
jgi:hypothetical protein